MSNHVVIDKERITDFCERHHIRRLAIFGSALRDGLGPESDEDLSRYFRNQVVASAEVQYLRG